MRYPVLLLTIALGCGPAHIEVLGEGRHDLVETLKADRVEVMPGAVVYLGPGVGLEATEDLRLAGEIIGTAGEPPLVLTAGQDLWVLGKVTGHPGESEKPGQSVRLVAGRDLVIRGVARGGDGGPGVSQSKPQAKGSRGRAGGDIIVDSGRNLTVSGVLTGGRGGQGGDANDLGGAAIAMAGSGEGGRAGHVELWPTRRLTVNGAATGGKGGPSGTARAKGELAMAAIGEPGAGGHVSLKRAPIRVEIPGTVRGGDSGEIGVETSFADGVVEAGVMRSASADPGLRFDLPGEDGRNAGAKAAWARMTDHPKEALPAVERTGSKIPMSMKAAAPPEPIEVIVAAPDLPLAKVTSADLAGLIGESTGQPAARARPFRRGDEVIGFRLSGVRRDRPIYRIGLRSGDVILAVNDMPITSTEGALQAYLALKDEVDIRVKLQRRGQLRVLPIRVE